MCCCQLLLQFWIRFRFVFYRKERKCNFRPDASRRTPGFLRGRCAVPSAPHLDGQGHRGLCKRYLPVEETEASVPESRRPVQRNQMPRHYILIALVSISPHREHFHHAHDPTPPTSHVSGENPFLLSITVFRPPESQLLQHFWRRNRKKVFDDQKQDSWVEKALF